MSSDNKSNGTSITLKGEQVLEDPNTITFTVNNGALEMLKLCPNGDIYVKGKLAANDLEVVDTLR